MKDNNGMGGAKIFKQNKILETTWSPTHNFNPALIFNQRAKNQDEGGKTNEGRL